MLLFFPGSHRVYGPASPNYWKHKYRSWLAPCFLCAIHTQPRPTQWQLLWTSCRHAGNWKWPPKQMFHGGIFFLFFFLFFYRLGRELAIHQWTRWLTCKGRLGHTQEYRHWIWQQEPPIYLPLDSLCKKLFILMSTFIAKLIQV